MIGVSRLGPVPLLLLSVALGLAWVLFTMLHMEANPDNAWLLLVAKRMLAGEHLYRDMLETNPPLIVWLNLVPAWISERFGKDLFLTFAACVSVVNVAALWLLAAIIKRRKDFIAPRIAFYYAVLMVLFLSAGIYGERELLFVALILPYLAQTLVAPGYEKYSKRVWLAYGFAAVGFALKPYFLVVWGINELYLALRHRNLLRLFSPGNFLIGGVQAVYWTGIFIFEPYYINTVLPAMLHVYFAFNASWESMAKLLGGVGVMTLFVAWLAGIKGQYRPAILQLCALIVACAIVLILQRKTWLNHAYVLVFPAGWCVFLMITALWQEMRSRRLDIGHRKFSALCFAFMMVMISLYLEGNYLYREMKNAGIKNAPLVKAIKNTSRGGEVYMLSFNLTSGFPLITHMGAPFHGSFHHLWPMPGLLALKSQKELEEKTLEIKQFMMDRLVEDFTQSPPRLVLVDQHVNLKTIGTTGVDVSGLDIIDYLSQDARFAALWKRYTQVGKVKTQLADDGETKEAEKTKPETYDLYSLAKP